MFLMIAFASIALSMQAAPEEKNGKDTLFVQISAERLDVYPPQFVESVSQTSEKVTVKTKDGDEHIYLLDLIQSASTTPPDSLPRINSFKFNNKFNDQVFTDAQGEIIGDSLIKVTVGGIGKRLTPSFQLSDSLAAAFVNGIRQRSKVSRLRFEEPVTYLVARPGWQVLCGDESKMEWQPYGRSYRVDVTWLTDEVERFPTIDIAVEDGAVVASKRTYYNAVITFDGAGIYPDLEDIPVQIKGRGNSSWHEPREYTYYYYDDNDSLIQFTYYYEPKNPYRLKFAEKVKPFGMTKGKSWVLQANRQNGSMMTNSIGMKAANLLGAAGANHIVPVDLYMNGSYRGSYIFNEKVGFSNNSIDLEDESHAFMIELDSYTETGQYKTKYYNLPTNIKQPDFNDNTTVTELKKQDILNDFEAFLKAVSRRNDISNMVDVDYLAAFLSVNELVGNYEIMHPKSTFLYKENLSDGKYVFGPVWDLDWAFGYQSDHDYFYSGATDNFYSAPAHTFTEPNDGTNTQMLWRNLRFNCSEEVDRACFRLWTKFIKQGGVDELLEFCDDYYAFVAPSFQRDDWVWYNEYDYPTSVERAKKWLSQRIKHIYSKQTPYDDILDEFADTGEWKPYPAKKETDEPAGIRVSTPRTTTLFTVYDLRGVLLKRNASFSDWRDGLKPGLYLVNGHKVLVE